MISTHPYPIKPIQEISKTEAEKLSAYGIAHYDEQGRIVSYAKYLDGHEDWLCNYFYNSGSVFEHEECRAKDGTSIKRYFGPDGSLLRTEP
jgi:antitoxin component YwqK of YwqJK toxin-antitoxin module